MHDVETRVSSAVGAGERPDASAGAARLAAEGHAILNDPRVAGVAAAGEESGLSLTADEVAALHSARDFVQLLREKKIKVG